MRIDDTMIYSSRSTTRTNTCIIFIISLIVCHLHHHCQCFLLRPPTNDKRSSVLKSILKSNNVVNEIEKQRDVRTIAIVGAGVGGLSVASRIASSPDLPKSTKVIILEKNSPDMIGGRCGSFKRTVPGLGEFRFERGPSLLLLKDVYLDLFRDCGKDAHNDYGIKIEQCYPAYQVVFEDGDAIQLGFPKMVQDICDDDHNKHKLEEVSRQKMNEYEHDGAKKWDNYMCATEAFLDCGLPNFIEERLDLKSFPSFIVEATKDGFKV